MAIKNSKIKCYHCGSIRCKGEVSYYDEFKDYLCEECFKFNTEEEEKIAKQDAKYDELAYGEE